MVKSMKKDIRTGLLFVSIFYVVAIVFLMIMNFCLSTSSIELHDSDENVKKIKELRREALALEVNKCSVVINDMITYYEKTSFDGDVNLKEKYGDLFFLSQTSGPIKITLSSYSLRRVLAFVDSTV